MDYAGLGVAGSIIAGLSGVYYLWTILKGQTKPHKITWFGWSLVAVLGAWSSFDGGGGMGALVAATFAVTLTLTFILSLFPKYGKPGGHPLDYVVAAISTVAIIIWGVGHFSPAIAATIAIVADTWFSWLTLREAWRQPETEALGPWIAGSIATALGVAALESFSYAAAAYPIYIMVANCAITATILGAGQIKKKELYP